MAEPLGDLQQLTMLAVARLGDDAYGASVREELRCIAGRKVAIATVHVTLVRLEDQGYVTSSRSSRHGGRPRRNFKLTRRAWTALRASRDSLARMWEGLEPA